ncbi:CRISPR-associated protein Csx3 [Roseofilum sp. BLCC_M91]|uniref:CRISPR-associated protein Csx3 n=1 Tax=Roseofilum halophilum BLCC-M91 TaxID=3022259 RepID=A0ABT7BNP4_9CYAN|nr:CRISPR-associated protein Csx3 [Roseofilum halophilum]MDJ1180710.1 CRISPR-associated protein Csx3 [Roseofilum halophilum BLCC-M91]
MEVELQRIFLKAKAPVNSLIQTLAINLLKPSELISTQALLNLQFPPDLDPHQPLLLFGRAPVWLYTYLGEKFSSFPWVAFFNIQEQAAIVVISHSSDITIGDTIPLEFSNNLSPALLIVGPPNSGKSVLSNTLRVHLSQTLPYVSSYLHRANWDGEGNHTYETPDRELSQRLKQKNKVPICKHPDAEKLLIQYFEDQAKNTHHIRNVVNLALVDVGGKPDPVKLPIIEQCTHYIIISSQPDQIPIWHKLCHGLTPVAVIHSVLEEKVEVLHTQPYLELIAGKWHRDTMPSVPDVLLQAISRIVK